MTIHATNRTMRLHFNMTPSASVPVASCDRRGGLTGWLIPLALGLASASCLANTSALATAGDAQLELGKYTEAERIYQKLGAEESGPALKARLARLAELKGNNEKAIELLRENVGIPAETAWYRVRLGELYFRTGKLDKAAEQYEAARELRPESFLVLEHLAELRAAKGKFDEAIALYQKVIAR